MRSLIAWLANLVGFRRQPSEIDDIRRDIARAWAEDRPPPGKVGVELCKRYDPARDGPTPCEWPYCECTAPRFRQVTPNWWNP
jgi:hypothetical protein